MSRKLKELMVGEIRQRFANLDQQGCVLVGIRGMSAQESADCRSLLASKKARMTVVRNRLFAIALDDLGASELKGLLDGVVAVITAENPVYAAQAAAEAVEGFPSLSFMGGYADGRVLDPRGIERLAKLPDRETLLTRTLQCVRSPAQHFVNCLNGALQRLASVLVQVRDIKQEEAPGA